VVFTSPVKKEKDKTDTIEIRVKDEIYSQEFVTYQELVTEDFSSGSSISLIEIKKIPQLTVTVTVPTDTATYNPATKKFDIGTEQGVPFTITLKNDKGKSKEILSSE
jgi:hypothetical protein